MSYLFNSKSHTVYLNIIILFVFFEMKILMISFEVQGWKDQQTDYRMTLVMLLFYKLVHSTFLSFKKILFLFLFSYWEPD